MAFKVPKWQSIPDQFTGWRPPRLDSLNLAGAKELTIDTETFDPDLLKTGPGVRREGYMVGVSVATEDVAFYLPIQHERQYDPQGVGLPREHVEMWCKENLCIPNVPKLFTNALYDLDYLWQAGIEVPGPYYDIQLNEPLIDENQRSYSLDTQANKYLGRGKEDNAMNDWCNDTFGKERDHRKNIYRTPPQLVAPYAVADVELPRQIHKLQQDILFEQGLKKVWEMENKLIPLMLAMRRRGVAVDVERAERVREELKARVDVMRKEMGIQDIWNAEQVAHMCDRSGIEYKLTEKTKKPSFTALWLEKHADPRLRMLVEARKLDKTVNTFIQGAILNNSINGRVHTQFHQLKSDHNGTISGRFSSSGPNLQNIPARDKEIGPLLRSMFLPDKGESWYCDDWSQLEFRLLVHYGEGPSAEDTQRAYNEDPTTDFHNYVSELTGIARKPAKNINFGLGYGMGVEKLARQLGKTIAEAKEIFEQYHERLPFIRDLMEKVSRIAENRGYIKTIMGRRRRFDRWEPRNYRKFGYNYRDNKPTPCSRDDAVFQWGENYIKRAFGYAALNGLMQGGNADLMKKSMVDIWEAGICDVLGAPLLTVHDELNWSVPRSKAAVQAHREAKHMMRDVVKLKVPLLVSSNHGRNWDEAK